MRTDSAQRHGVSLDVHGAQNPVFWDRGIARYIVEHASALLELAPERVHTVRASTRMGITPSLLRLAPSGKLMRDRAEPRDAAGRPPAIHHAMSPLEWGYEIDDVWPLWARHPGCLRVVTLYDLIPFVFPEWYKALLPDRVGYDARIELTRRADQVLAISEHTARDATRLLGIPRERITVIGAAATSSFRDLWPRREDAHAFVRRRFGLARNFAFYVGGQDERKNLTRLVEAWARLDEPTRDRTTLVVTCELSPERLAMLERHAARHGLRRDDLRLTGRVTDHELAALYRACSLFVFASLYEGSGLPILEAMTAEAPVVAAVTSTGPELLGERDGTFDPRDPGDMARVIGEALGDPSRLERYRARSAARVTEFSWRRVAERTLAGYEQALERRRPVARTARRARRRVALIAPGPRPRAAPDDAVERLAARLGEHADVELIRDGDPAAAPARFELRRARGYYDSTIHVLGGAPAHRYPYETLVRDPGGIALFEDVRLGAFHCWYAERVGGPLWLRRELDRQYGEQLPHWIALRGRVTEEDIEANGLLFTRRVQQLASAVIAPSPGAAALLELDRLGQQGARLLVEPDTQQWLDLLGVR